MGNAFSILARELKILSGRRKRRWENNTGTDLHAT
jgi:hypothetical protein